MDAKMDIRGFVPFTTLDYPGKLACVVFCGGCNMRCPYCHNGHLVLAPESQQAVPEEEVLGFLRKRGGRLEGVVVSGGEPTLQPGLEAFAASVKSLGFLVRVDTNGSHSGVILRLIQRKLLDATAVDFKGTVAGYPAASGAKKNMAVTVLRTISFAMVAGIELEVRTTIHKRFHGKDDLAEMRRLLDGVGVEEWVWQRYRKAAPIDTSLEEAENWSAEEIGGLAASLHDIKLRDWR